MLRVSINSRNNFYMTNVFLSVASEARFITFQAKPFSLLHRYSKLLSNHKHLMHCFLLQRYEQQGYALRLVILWRLTWLLEATTCYETEN